MKDNRKDRTRHENRLDQKTNIGGCTETWEALSEVRHSDSSAGRRSFVKRIGLTIGAISFGAGTATAHNTSHSTNDTDVDIDARPLSGKERGHLLEEANTSGQMRYVVNQLGKKPDVSTAFEYTVGDDSGRGVIYGDPEGKREEPVIKYYESAAFDGTDVKVMGGYGSGKKETAVRTVDGDRGVVMDIHTTEAVNAAESNYEAFSAMKANADANGESEQLAVSEAVLARDTHDPNDLFDIYVPIIEDDKIVDRVVISGTGNPQAPESVSISAGTGDTDNQVRTQGHTICGPFGQVCTDYCTILCSSLAGVSGTACFSACTGTVAGMPISPGCAAVCAGVVGGTCYPTCTNQTGH